jgi:hypothetical protein
MHVRSPYQNHALDLVNAFATTRDAQKALLDDPPRLWTEANQTRAVSKGDDPDRRFVVTGDATASARLQWAIPILETLSGVGVDDAGMQMPTSACEQRDTGGGVKSQFVVRTYDASVNQAMLMLSAYDALKESVYSALVVQTRLQPYLGAIDLVIDETGSRFDTTAAVALVNTKAGTNAYNAVIELIELKKYVDGTSNAIGFGAVSVQVDATWVAANERAWRRRA